MLSCLSTPLASPPGVLAPDSAAYFYKADAAKAVCDDQWDNPVQVHGRGTTCGKIIEAAVRSETQGREAFLRAVEVGQNHSSECYACNLYNASHPEILTAPAFAGRASLLATPSVPAFVAKRSDVKLVLNSATNYTTPRTKLLESLDAAGWKEWRNVIVALGGDQHEVAPILEELGSLVEEDSPLRGRRENVTVMRTPIQNFDFHGMDMLSRHREHELVAAPAYLYSLDTMTVHDDFVAKLDALLSTRLTSAESVASVRVPASNIAAFGSGALAAMGRNYEPLLTKFEATWLEFGMRVTSGQLCNASRSVSDAESALDSSPVAPCRNDAATAGRTVHPILAFGDVQWHGERARADKIDLYGTGTPRVEYRYDTFGLSKYINEWSSGDFTTEKKP